MKCYLLNNSVRDFFVADMECGYWIHKDGNELTIYNSIYKQSDGESFVVNRVYQEVDMHKLLDTKK